MLKINELMKQFGRQMIFKNLSVEFKAQKINVIIGPSGCGKTTLFNCISGLEAFEHGAIWLNDQLLFEGGPLKTSKTQMEKIGYVLQGFSLFSHLSVIDNLTLAPHLILHEPKNQAQERAKEILDKMHLLDKQNLYPYELSGGQQQRAAIARAIMMHPKVLLLDEPTNALDPQLVLVLEKTLKSLVEEGLTLLVSTHHLAFAKRIADYTYFLNNGEFIDTSEGNQLLINPTNPEVQRFIQEEESYVS